MYQEQQYYALHHNPNPGDNPPPPPGVASFTYQQHGVGNFGAMTAMGSAYMHPAPPMMSNVTVTTMQPGISLHVQCEDCKKIVQKQAVTSVTAQNMSSVTPASAPSIVKLEDKGHRINQNETAFQTHVKHVAKQAGTGGGGELITPKSEDDCLKNSEQSQKPSLPHNPVPTSEAVSTPKVVEPVSTPKVVEPVSSPKVVEPVSTPKVVEPVSSPKVVEPVSTPKVVEPVLSHEVKPTCELCGISCDTNAMLNVHKAGKKHIKNMKLMKPVLSHEVKPTCELCGISCNTNAMLNVHKAGNKHIKNMKRLKKHICEICGISCDTNAMLEAHFSGAKHQKNLKKLGKPSVLPATDDGGEIATPVVVDQLQDSLKDDKIVNEGGSIRKGKRAGSELDVETKKQKIREGETAPIYLEICNVCSVVCLSPEDFDDHMAGQEHQAKAQ